MLDILQKHLIREFAHNKVFFFVLCHFLVVLSHLRPNIVRFETNLGFKYSALYAQYEELGEKWRIDRIITGPIALWRYNVH